MKKLLLPILIGAMGTGGGAAAGHFLKKPASDQADAGHAEDAAADEHAADTHAAPATDDHGNAVGPEYAKLNNQFVVPIVHNGAMQSLVVMSLSVEVPSGGKTAVFEAEPKLRDALFGAMLHHANLGGFDGAFTGEEKMRTLRESLRGAAKNALGDAVNDVLILDIARQDV